MDTLDRYPEHWNPVTVRDVRQWLRGRLFTIGFILALVVAVVAATTVLFEFEGTELGRPLLRRMYPTFVAAVAGLVPLSAFLAMRRDRTSGHLEHLKLAGLGEAKLVRGKVLAAQVQAALVGSAFLPIAVLAFLAGGVNLGTTIVLVVLAFEFSVTSTYWAVGLGGTSCSATAEGLLVAILFGTVALLVITSNNLADLLTSTDDFWRGTLLFPTWLLLGATLFCRLFAIRQISPPLAQREYTARMIVFPFLYGAFSIGLIPIIAFFN